MLSVKDGLNPQVVVVTSPVPGEGKSLISINLSLAFGNARDGRALLIDADLRRPTQTKWLTPAPGLGLAEVLHNDVGPEHAVLQIKDTNLDILPAGKLEADPGDLLASNRMQELMQEFRSKYFKIVIDTPPIVPFTDADHVAAHSDGVLLVVRTSRTKISEMRHAESLVNSAPLLGLIVNDQSPTIGGISEKYNAYYNEYYSEGRKR
jgi:capsular exopolysaccharide synthesis family protein